MSEAIDDVGRRLSKTIEANGHEAGTPKAGAAREKTGKRIKHAREIVVNKPIDPDAVKKLPEEET